MCTRDRSWNEFGQNRANWHRRAVKEKFFPLLSKCATLLRTQISSLGAVQRSTRVSLFCELFRIIAQVSELHNATISSDNPRFHEQNVARIFDTLEKCLSALRSSLTRVKAVQVAGQMHGCVLWSSQRTCGEYFAPDARGVNRNI